VCRIVDGPIPLDGGEPAGQATIRLVPKTWQPISLPVPLFELHGLEQGWGMCIRGCVRPCGRGGPLASRGEAGRSTLVSLAILNPWQTYAAEPIPRQRAERAPGEAT
jgi:hypothetical protein